MGYAGGVEFIIERRLEPLIGERLTETPVLLLEGPRSVGKSLLLTRFAAVAGQPILDLDEVAYRQFAHDNPSAVAQRQPPVIIDEYQREPELLDAIKARLNQGATPGTFVLAGSSSFGSLPSGTQALTGRLQRLPVMPLTQTEIDATGNSFIADAFEGGAVETLGTIAEPTTRSDYIKRVMRGGMPLAVGLGSEAARTRWFQAHVRESITRDAGQLRRIGRTGDLRDILMRAVGQTASLLNVSKVAADVQPSWGTTADYINLLEALFLIQRLPAWGVTVLPRTLETPKIHIVDSGIGAFLLRLSSEKMARLDPASLTEFGHLLESFVVSEAIRQTTWMEAPVVAGYWRNKDKVEVDLVLERYDGAVVAIEVKASDHVDSRQLAPLRALRDRLGSSFQAGLAFYLGPVGYQADDSIYVLPVDRLWK